jgi:DNA-binding transcriptional MerR regulator
MSLPFSFEREYSAGTLRLEISYKVKPFQVGGQMRIGELAQRTGVDEQLLRYYEKQGLLHPDRATNGYRIYAESDVTAVRRIRELLAAGLTTATIAELGDCVRNTPPTPACDRALTHLHQARTTLDQSIARLQSAHQALTTLINRRPPHHNHPNQPGARTTQPNPSR